jgi:hypothetical protein
LLSLSVASFPGSTLSHVGFVMNKVTLGQAFAE